MCDQTHDFFSTLAALNFTLGQRYTKLAAGEKKKQLKLDTV